ncbi:coniferyl aldehyde dehydrogenase [Pseudoxanthomonas dokdonensis]|uniref:Aldehyde dehydrogenase n=1 Tax=Pseudoxanthomonas dokdonensis TaxID=344882 RepID=A0A0R0CGX3_9GAMM|nr:coniferyl aldehyde dehydrogenase [Pseudoxanthomonas dokdonensis]KRG68342.1 coniferyl aldehyde dehydrogenase [Pseudoxanthomonas dokdonensis]
MTSTANAAAETPAIPAEFQDALASQRAHFERLRYPSHEQRVADLKQMVRLVADNRDALIEAVNQDYGCRSRFETGFAEIAVTLDGLQEAIKHLKRWMKPQKRHVDPMRLPLARARLLPQPVGVVGVVVPWNFPIAMVFHPLTSIFAAGNTAMVKMSENSNHLAQLLKTLSPKYFPTSKLVFFEDGGGRGPAFTALPFDHIFFTGSPATGKAVMANAARNLTPVTLELGGKSPAIIAPDYDVQTAAKRVIWAKTFNAGQICTNIDYLLMPQDKIEAFAGHAREAFASAYPDINNGDYTAIIDQRSHDRLQAALEDARSKGARIVELAPDQTPDASRRIMSPKLVLDVNDDMELMQREIFGPILPIRSYRTREEAAQYINDRPRPLSLYPFTNDKSLAQWYIMNTLSGGVTVNDSILHVSVHTLPFGGIGNSGMGHYHGVEGFNTFSKLRPILYQGPLRAIDWLSPPYGQRARKVLELMIRMKS